MVSNRSGSKEEGGGGVAYLALAAVSVDLRLELVGGHRGNSQDGNQQHGFHHPCYTPEREANGMVSGVFIPLLVAFPEASIPVVAVSIFESLDPAAVEVD